MFKYVHDSSNRTVEKLGDRINTGFEALKHVLKILVKIGRVSINEVRFTQFGEISENFNGDQQRQILDVLQLREEREHERLGEIEGPPSHPLSHPSSYPPR